MSYVATTFGDTEPFDSSTLDVADVFVWRANVNTELSEPDDLRRIVRAIGRQCFHSWWGPLKYYFGFDVRGVVVHPDHHGLDVVLQKGRSDCGLNTIALYPDGISEAVVAADDVRARWAEFKVVGTFLKMVGPKSALDFWRSHNLLWDAHLGDSPGGGPTQLFSQGGGFYVGMADNVQTIKPFAAAPPPGPGSVPITPTPVPGGTTPASSSSGMEASTILLVLGTIAVVWVASAKLWR